MIYLKCISAVLVLVSAIFISKKYSYYCNEKALECQQLLSFLKKMRNNISLYLLPLSNWRGDLSGMGDACHGFFFAITQGAEVSTAFAAVKDKLSLPDDIKGELYGFFSDFGRGYMNNEIKKLDSAIATLESALPRLTLDAKNENRAGSAVIIAAALGAVILLI